MESFSEHAQTRAFENHTNLLTYLANWLLFTSENHFQGVIKCQGSPFLGFTHVFFCSYCSKKLPEQAPTKTQLRVLSIIDQLREWAHRRTTYAQLSPVYPSLYPYVTHVINYPRPSPAFPYCKATVSWVGPGNEVIHYIHCCFNTFWLLCCRCKSL